MPIQHLSDATSRVLTSTQTLNTATSVVKELVENALDACASSISVEIASNTLDKIIVRDDGSGIGVQDRQLLCKKGCTSKIANLDDLAKLGGTFLGFRGTALASIAELSKEVTVVTKVDGEQPATTMTFGTSGRLLSSGSASHNVGTTVRVENFLASIPVRRQVVLKNPSKVVEEIKRLLQGYGLARPFVKLSFKVLKAKNDKVNWSFAACRGDDRLMSAAVQVAGKIVAGFCKLYTTDSAEVTSCDTTYKAEGLLFEVNSEDVDMSKTGNVGQYTFVDGRPVSHDKGIMKELVKKYKTYLQSACGSNNTLPSKPFLVLHLTCPKGSYDVNVEPAKDVVLFHHEEKVIESIDGLFVKAYGEVKESAETGSDEINPKSTGSNNNSFDLLLARKKPESHMMVDQPGGHEAGITSRDEDSSLEVLVMQQRTLAADFAKAKQHIPTLPSQPSNSLPTQPANNVAPTKRMSHNMSEVDDDLQDESIHSTTQDEEEEHDIYDPKDVLTNNPFTRAKIYSLQRPKLQAVQNHSDDTDASTGGFIDETQLQQPTATSSPSIRGRVSMNRVYSLPTPGTSPTSSNVAPYQNPGPPYPRRSGNAIDDEEEERQIDEHDSASSSRVQQATLSKWATSSPIRNNAGALNLSPSSHFQLPLGELHSSSRRSALNAAGSKQHSHPIPTNKPYRSPLKTSHRVPDMIANAGYSHSRSNQEDAHLSNQNASPITPSIVDDNDDLQHILEFETRKKAANKQQKLNQRRLTPADLARIQQGSDIDIDIGARSAYQARFDTQVAGENFELTEDRGAVGALPHSSNPTKSNPHLNRRQAALRHLDAGVNQSQPEPVPSLNNTAPFDDQQRHMQGEAETTIPTSDPRGYLISHQQTSKDTVSSKLKAKRVKSSKLPFETIPPEETKYNLTATPADSFPLSNHLLDLSQTLRSHDTYITRGSVRTVTWSPHDKDVEHWQEIIEDIVKRRYRANINIGDDGDGDGDGREVAHKPPVSIPLARILKAHIDSL